MHRVSSLSGCRQVTAKLLSVAGLFAFALNASAQLPQPKLHTVFPPGAKIGSTVEVAVTGAELDDVQLRFTHPGITVKALANADLRKRITEIGMTAVGNTSEEFAKDIKVESERWAKIIKERNLQVK